jgi:hypothetical protein
MGRRTARAALRRVDALFSRNGPAFKRLAVSWAANVAGDTLVAISLAGTLFFDVPSTEARSKVALYLLLTLAPFAVVAPLLGAFFARFPGTYRAMLTGSSALRALLAVVMAFGLATFWLFPLAFSMLVLSRLYGISKSSLLPAALPDSHELVAANALLARIGIYAGAVVAPIGVVATQIPRIESAGALIVSIGFFLFSAFIGLGLPKPAAPRVQRAARSRKLLPRPVRLSRTATAGVRMINGFLILILAFSFRDADAGALDFGALVAAGGIGYGLASFLAPWLERRLREEPMVVAALALEAAAAFIAGQFFGLPAAAALAAAAGLAWGMAKFAFDGLLQTTAPPDQRGAAFVRAETVFQLAWVVGAVIPALVTVTAEVGLAIAGVAALATQTVFVASLLTDLRASKVGRAGAAYPEAGSFSSTRRE